MKLTKTNPFQPCVTLKQVVAFDPAREETFTASPLINAVLAALKGERITTQSGVARYLALDSAGLGAAVKILTGHTFNHLRDVCLRHEAKRLMAEHPEWSSGELAEAVGYQDNSSLWRLFHRDYDRRYYQSWRNQDKSYVMKMLDERAQRAKNPGEMKQKSDRPLEELDKDGDRQGNA